MKSEILKSLGLIFFLVVVLLNIGRYSQKKKAAERKRKTISFQTIPQKNYSNLSDSTFSADSQKIGYAWNYLNNSNKDLKLKMEFLSMNYLIEINSRIKSALYSSDEKLSLLPIEKRIHIYDTRKKLKNLFTSFELINSDYIELGSKFFFITTGFISNPDLTSITFESDTLAYGFYNVSNEQRSVEFTVENNHWRANPFRGHEDYENKKDALIKENIANSGSEEKFLKNLFANNPNIFNPIR